MALTEQQIRRIKQRLAVSQIGNSSQMEESQQDESALDKVKGFMTGAGKGILKTARGTLSLLEKTGSKISGIPVGEKGTLAEQEVSEDLVTAKNPAEKAGMFTEQLAEFLIPITKVKNLSLAQKIVKEATEFGLRSSAQEGELQPSAFAIGGATPLVAKAFSPLFSGLKKVGGALKETGTDILRATTSVPEKALQRAATAPSAVREGFKKNVNATTIRDEAIGAMRLLKNEADQAFSKGLEDLRKLAPRSGMAREVGGQFSAVKSQMSNILGDKTEGIKRIFNDFRISLDKNKLNFDKLNSAITNTGEQNQIKRVWETLINQKDFSVKGVQDVAARLNSLRDYEKAGVKASSAVVGKMISAYDKAIEKVYPNLAKLRNEYSQLKKITGAADEVLKYQKGKTSETAKRTAVAKLTNLFKEDNDVYLNSLRALEDRTGVKFLDKLAGTEFQKITPSILRTSLALGSLQGAALGAVGVAGMFNPIAWLLLPLFSPRAVGGLITNTAQSKMLLEELIKIGTGSNVISNQGRLLIDKIIQNKLDEN